MSTENETPKKSSRGGARQGSGRKRGRVIQDRTFTARAVDVELLKKIKELTGENIRDIFARMIKDEYQKVIKNQP